MEPLGRLLGGSWEALGASWEALGSILELSWDIFRAQKGLGKRLGSDHLDFRKTLESLVGSHQNRGSEGEKSM